MFNRKDVTTLVNKRGTMIMAKKSMKSLTLATVATTLAVPAALVGATAEDVSNQQQEQVTEQLIVKYKDTANSTYSLKRSMLVQENLVTADTAIIEQNESFTVLEVNAEDVEEVQKQLEQNSQVEYVEKNVRYEIAATNDPYFTNQWNLDAISAPNAWGKMPVTSSDSVTVAVLDTGVQLDHEDLDGRVLNGDTFVDGYDESHIGADDQGHGTFVAGIIAAKANNGTGMTGVVGEANVNILPVKVMNKNGSGTAADIAKGIEYAIAQNVDVINMSLSGEYSETVNAAVQKAADQGIVVVAASGNGGGNADTSFPAALPNVISVGAVATNDQHYTRSNSGETVDIVAPGVSILSTTTAEDKYITGSGTSYAAPHVAAVAAMYKLKNPNATAVEIEEAMKATATDLLEDGWDAKTGYGKINAEAMLADEIDINPLSFTLPKANANLLGSTKVQMSIANLTNVEKTIFYIDEMVEANVIGTVEGASATPQIDWDTTTVADGQRTIIAATYDAEGVLLSTVSRDVTVLNAAQSGYMFDVETPTGTIAQAASVFLYEKQENEDGSYQYKELWTGLTNTDGVVRVPSHIGTDLKNLQVVVQGTFDADNGNSWFMYSREVNDIGTVTLASENTVPVELETTNKKGEDLTHAQYFISMKDAKGVELTATRSINEENATIAPTVYLDKGTYNMYAHVKDADDTYFLTQSNTTITDVTTSLKFDGENAGTIGVQNEDGKLENAILYLYDDAVTDIFGTKGVLTGRNFYVTAGDYDYIIDAEVKDIAGGENWIYIFSNNGKKVEVKAGGESKVQAGKELTLTQFEPDHDALRRYYTQRGFEYIEREDPLTTYKLDRAYYTKQEFTDGYGNMLAGMRRGSLESDDALYVKNTTTGETRAIGDEEATVTAIDYGDIYATYQIKRQSDGKIMLNSHDKNPTNPANRNYYFYSFWVTTASDVTPGKYEISLTLGKSPLAPDGIDDAMEITMEDSSATTGLVDADGKGVAAYIWIMSAFKDEDGDIEWKQQMVSNTDTSRKLSVPSNFELSEEEQGNVAIYRYKVASGEFGYIFRTFDEITELETIEIPENMQKVDMIAKNGEADLGTVSSKQWQIKYPMNVGGETAYATANNFQNYKFNAVYLEPGKHVIEGNYVSLPDEDLQRSNYYFLEEIDVTDEGTNEVVFNTDSLAKVTVDAQVEGFNDLRGAIIYPYNKYSSTFTPTLRAGHTFYIPSDVEMTLQAQLGFGDKESTNKIWNYFVTQGEQIFTAGQQENWQVGGTFQAKTDLLVNSFVKNPVVLEGTAKIEDSYNNMISSILINQTNDYSTAADQEKAYTLLANGQIEETIIPAGEYEISHSEVPEPAAASVKPIITVYNQKGDIVLKEASLNYYKALPTNELQLEDGTYRIELSVAASPQGPIQSSEIKFVVTTKTESGTTEEEANNGGNEGSTGDNNSGEQTEDNGKPSGGSSGSSTGGSNGGSSGGSGGSSGGNSTDTTSSNTTVNTTTPTQPVEEATAVATGTLTEAQVKEAITNGATNVTVQATNEKVQVKVPVSTLTNGNYEFAAQFTGEKLQFNPTLAGENVVFTEYVEVSFPISALTDKANFAIVRKDGETVSAVPYTIRDGVVTLKVRKGGEFIVTTETKVFADISKNGNKNYIEKLTQRQIINGTSETEFAPNKEITRGQFAAMVARALDLELPTEPLSFEDIQGKWYEGYVNALTKAGIIKGKSETQFDPGATLTRQQAAVMMTRMLEYLNVKTDGFASDKQFGDFDKLSEEAKDSVNTLATLQIMSGKENGQFDPSAPLTRSQMAKILYLSLEKGDMLN